MGSELQSHLIPERLDTDLICTHQENGGSSVTTSVTATRTSTKGNSFNNSHSEYLERGPLASGISKGNWLKQCHDVGDEAVY